MKRRQVRAGEDETVSSSAVPSSASGLGLPRLASRGWEQAKNKRSAEPVRGRGYPQVLTFDIVVDGELV